MLRVTSLSMGKPRKLLSGCLVLVRSQYDRLSGEVVLAKILPSGPHGVPGHAHFDHVHVDARLGETQSGDGSAVSGADHEGRDMGPGVDRSGCGTDPGLSRGAVTREGHGS